jgi:putative NIF3 family GTP cyclohydrolase 1 type 2
MTIKEIYSLAIKKGIEADFREKKQISDSLKKLEKKYQEMNSREKEFFDLERLNNPFSDTRILFGDSNKKIKKILVGIDIDGEEVLLAKELGDIDLIVSHHPRGEALAGLDDVMQLQADVLHLYGVPINIAEKMLKKRIEEVARGLSPVNHSRVVDIARHLKIPLMSIHTPCDNLAAQFIDQKIKKDKPVFVGDLIDSLNEVPEYKEASRIKAGPKIFVGSRENRVGEIAITEMTGGTEGAPEIYEKIAQAGIGTVVGMHISEKHREEAEKAHINVVIAGHISSDSIGVNLFLDELEKKNIEIVPCSGLIRVSRAKNK